MSESRIPRERLLELATAATRLPGFHHDCASKLQSLMMALDEISELLGEEQGDLKLALDTAQTATRELNELFSLNRALTKPPVRTSIAIGALLEMVAAKVGVRVRGTVPAQQVHVAMPAIRHVLGLVIGAICGPVISARCVDVSSRVDGNCLVLVLAGAQRSPTPAEDEAIEIATYICEREGGGVHVVPPAVELRLPLPE